MITNHRNMSMLVIISIVFGLAGCGKGPLTEAQSEIAGYCISYLATVDGGMEIDRLSDLIRRHIHERGFSEKGIKSGGLRRDREVDEKKKKTLNDSQISESRQVLNW